MGITELILVLIVALIVIPPEKLPEVMRTAGKILRELKLASNTMVRELSESIDDPASSHQPPPAIARPSLTRPAAAAPPAETPAAPVSPDSQS